MAIQNSAHFRSIEILHMTAMGRLRLGRLRPPVVMIFLSILSLGAICLHHASRILDETQWHLKRNYTRQWWEKNWLLLLPGFHIVYGLWLTQKVRSVDSEHGTTHTSWAVAAILSIIPPLLLAYLQANLNDHWRLHAVGEQQPALDPLRRPFPAFSSEGNSMLAHTTLGKNLT